MQLLKNNRRTSSKPERFHYVQYKNNKKFVSYHPIFIFNVLIIQKCLLNLNFNLSYSERIRMKVITCLILSLLLTSGCFSIKSDYPRVEYYRLSPEPLSLKNIAKINASLLVRDFSAGGELDTEHLTVLWSDNQVQQYYYHRWVNDCATLVTDFIINRYNQYNAFGGSVVRSSSYILPDYILEGQILELIAVNNAEKSKEPCNVSLSIQVNLLSRIPLKPENKVVLSKVYNLKVPRENNSVKTIVTAASKGISQIADKLLIDIQTAIATEQMSKENQ